MGHYQPLFSPRNIWDHLEKKNCQKGNEHSKRLGKRSIHREAAIAEGRRKKTSTLAAVEAR